jgi:hypothetical protein
MTENNQVEATEAAVENTETQGQEENNNNTSPAFTQEQLDKIIEDRLAKQRRALEKRYAGVDPEHYKELASAEETKKLEAKKARGEFEAVLKETVSKHQQTVEQLRNELHSVKVDGAVLSAANKSGAINAQQVVALVKNQIRLGDDGNAEVLDTNGQPRYAESGDPMSVDALVKEFLESNPHFKAATPGGTSSQSNLTPAKDTKVNLADLDMNNPDHRKIYGEAKRLGQL